MNSLAVKIWLSVLLLLVGVYAVYSGIRLLKMQEPPDPKRTLNIRPARPLADFQFVERSGKPVGLADLEGEIFVVNFFFANCPASCLRLNQTVAALQQEFKDTDVRFVSITVEPTTDTPEKLQTYAKQFGADPVKWWFLNAPLADVQDLGDALKVSVRGNAHTNELIVIDRAGIVRGAYDFENPLKMANLKKDLRQLLGDQPRGWKPSAAASSTGAVVGTASASATATASTTNAKPTATATSTAAPVAPGSR